MVEIKVAYVRIPGDADVHEIATLTGVNLVAVGRCVACGKWTGWWVRHRGYIADCRGGGEEVELRTSHIPCLAACCGNRFLADHHLTVADGEIIGVEVMDFLKQSGVIGPTAVPC